MSLSAGFSLILNLTVQLPTGLSPDESEALLAACSQALEPERCELNGAGAEANARIEQVEDERFIMEVTIETSKHQRITSREFTFKPEDARIERARSLGLSLGLLTRTSRALEPETEQAPPPARDVEKTMLKPEQAVTAQPQDRKSPPPREPTRATQWLSEMQLGVGYESGLQTPLYLGELRAGIRPVTPLAIIVSLRVAGSRRDEEQAPLDIVQVGGMLGFGYHHALPFGRLGIEVEAGVNNMAFSSPAAEARDSRVVFVMRGQIPLHIDLGPNLYCVVAPQAHVSASATEIYWNGQLVARTGQVVPTLNLGLGLDF